MEIKRENVCDYISGGKSAGFVKLSRRFYLLKEWQERRVLSSAEALLDLILLTDNKEQAVEISLRQLVDRWGWNYSKVRRFLIAHRFISESVSESPNESPKVLENNIVNNNGESPNESPNESKKEKETKEKEKFPPHPLYKEKENKEKEKHALNSRVCEAYSRFIEWLSRECPYVAAHIELPAPEQFAKLKDEYSSQEIADCCLKIENRTDLRKKYKNLYRTLLNWLKLERARNERTNYHGNRQETTEERNRRIIAETAAVIASRQAEDDRHRDALRRP